MNWKSTLKLAAIVAVVVLIAAFFWQPLIQSINLGLDLQGGVHIVYQAQGTEENPVDSDTMSRAMAVLDKRINEFGVTEPIIQQQGEDRIIVELPGVQDPEKAVESLGRTALLEFKTEDGKTVLTGSDLKDAQESKRSDTGSPEVMLEFTTAGTKKFADITRENVGKVLGIYLDDKPLTTPVINEPITQGYASIEGGFADLEEAHDLAVLLRSGALPVGLEILEKRAVGPTLGADSLNMSLNAAVYGLGLVLIFMILYYRLPGLVADFSLVLYVLIVLGALSAINATLTLPGIAGLLLSIGMAVDANIIIFERLKEELKSGKTLRSAIKSGFNRAIVAVIDANATTLIATAVLFYFGSGPIRGFAVTLSIGIIASMFTAITFTRTLLLLTADTKIVKNLKFYGA